MKNIVYSHKTKTRRISSRSELLRTDGEHVYLGGDAGRVSFDKEGVQQFEGAAVAWDEISHPFIGRNIFVSVGRVDYNFDQLTVDFTTTARYPEDFVGTVIQMNHSRKLGSAIRPHIHWMQTIDAVPNILVSYRWFNNGDVPSDWELKALTAADLVFSYTEGAQQISEFNLPDSYGLPLELSATFECKVYRDTQNTSGLFAGADAYAAPWAVKYYDVHFQKDAAGSRKTFLK